MHLQAWVAVHRRREGWRLYATAAAFCMPVLRFATPRSTLPLFPRDSLRAFLCARGRLAVHSYSALSASSIIVSQYCELAPMGVHQCLRRICAFCCNQGLANAIRGASADQSMGCSHHTATLRWRGQNRRESALTAVSIGNLIARHLMLDFASSKRRAVNCGSLCKAAAPLTCAGQHSDN
jgi:hypothetical protein